MKRISEMSPRFKARLAGAFELLEGSTSTIGQVVILGRLVIAGDAAATAANLVGHQRLVWLGFASSLAGVALHLAWALLMYELLKPVDRTVARLSVFAVLVCCALQALAAVLFVAPLVVLNAANAASAFTPQQSQALMQVFFRLNGYAFDADLVFFGLWCFLTGSLIFKSTFLPRVFGVLLMLDGLGWMTYIAPPFAVHLFPVIAAVSGLAELPLPLWLLIVGVNAERWNEQAAAAGGRPAGSSPTG